MTQHEVIWASSCSSSLLATSVRKSDNPIIFLFSGGGRRVIESVSWPMNQHASEDGQYTLSSIAGCTFALMVNRFSAMLASKSTYKFKIRNKWKNKSHSQPWTNGRYNSIDEGGDVVEIIWEAFTDITEQLNGLRKVSYFVPDTHCTVDRLWKHTNTVFCKQSVSLSHTIWKFCSSDLVKTLPVAHSGVRKRHPPQQHLIYTETYTRLHTAQQEQTAKQVEQCLEPDWNVADVAEQRLQGVQCIGVLRWCKETDDILSPV